MANEIKVKKLPTKRTEPPPMGVIAVARSFDLVEIALRFGLIPFFFWLCVRELAGQETIVDVMVQYFSKGGNLMPWGLAGGASVWAFAERKLRQHKTSKMSEHLNQLEKRLDPKRSSSGLTATGQTPVPGKVIPFVRPEVENESN